MRATDIKGTIGLLRNNGALIEVLTVEEAEDLARDLMDMAQGIRTGWSEEEILRRLPHA